MKQYKICIKGNNDPHIAKLIAKKFIEIGCTNTEAFDFDKNWQYFYLINNSIHVSLHTIPEGYSEYKIEQHIIYSSGTWRFKKDVNSCDTCTNKISQEKCNLIGKCDRFYSMHSHILKQETTEVKKSCGTCRSEITLKDCEECDGRYPLWQPKEVENYKCATCGSDCSIGGEGSTHFYIPKEVNPTYPREMMVRIDGMEYVKYIVREEIEILGVKYYVTKDSKIPILWQYAKDIDAPIKSAIEMLCEEFQCVKEDLQLNITLNPDKARFVRAMENYYNQFQKGV
jgi:hypothetical protein